MAQLLHTPTPVDLELHIRVSYQPRGGVYRYTEALADVGEPVLDFGEVRLIPEYEAWSLHNLMRQACGDLVVFQHHRWRDCAF